MNLIDIKKHNLPLQYKRDSFRDSYKGFIRIVLKQPLIEFNQTLLDYYKERLQPYFKSDVEILIRLAIDSIEIDSNGFGIDDSHRTEDGDYLVTLIKILQYGNNVVPAFNVITQANRIFIKEFGNDGQTIGEE